MGGSESYMLSNVAGLLKSQEELIQVKHGDNIWMIEIYQENSQTEDRYRIFCFCYF